MNTKTKKGFTLTELIIVVVIIGILAAVLIPTLTACVKKAKISNDKQLVRNLNLALSTDSLANHDGEKHKNMQEALDAAEIAGYLVDRINATKADNEILWDSENDVFCYLNDGDIEYIPSSVSSGDELNDDDPIDAAKLWQIVKLTGNEQLTSDAYPFSVYAAPGSVVAEIETNKGFDAGKEAYTSISYVNNSGIAKNVVIRTKGGILTINGYVNPTDPTKGDTVQHYGEAEKVDVVSMANASYHENGEVELIKVQKGHVKLEAGAQVLGVYVYTEDALAGFADIKITVNQGTEIPQLSRSAVVIDDEGTKVCTVVTDQAKDIYLFNQGIYEQIKVADEGAAKSTAEWVDTVAAHASENTQNAAWQLANEYNGTRSGNAIDDKTVEITDGEGTVTYTVKFDAENRTFETYTTGENPTKVVDANVINATTEAAVDQSGKDETQATSELGLFGKGTKDDPFLIYNYATMQKISNYYTDGYYYYSVAIERTENGIIDCAGWTPVRLHGSFNGNGVKFTNLDKHLFAAIVGVTTDGSAYSGNAGFYTGSAESFNNSTPITVENFTIEAQIKGTAVAAGVAHSVGTNITFKNINVNGYIEGYTASGIANYGAYQFGDDSSRNPENTQFRCNLTFENCNVSATLVALNEGAAGLIQHPYSNANSVWTVNNCTINAEMYAKNLDNAPRTFLYNYQQPSLTLIINGEETHVTSSIKYTGMKAHTLIYNSPALSAPVNKGDNFTITATTNASYAMFGLIISPNPGSMTATYINERVELNGNSFTSNLIKYCDVKINSVNAAPGYNQDYTVYNVNSTAFNGTSNGQYVQVVQYAADGSILSISTCDLSLISQ